jgi:hypothetical protein
MGVNPVADIGILERPSESRRSSKRYSKRVW